MAVGRWGTATGGSGGAEDGGGVEMSLAMEGVGVRGRRRPRVRERRYQANWDVEVRGRENSQSRYIEGMGNSGEGTGGAGGGLRATHCGSSASSARPMHSSATAPMLRANGFDWQQVSSSSCRHTSPAPRRARGGVAAPTVCVVSSRWLARLNTVNRASAKGCHSFGQPNWAPEPNSPELC